MEEYSASYPEGTFVIRKEDGTVLSSGHNRVVDTGRDMIFGLFKNNVELGDGTKSGTTTVKKLVRDDASAEYVLYEIIFGKSTDPTLPATDFNSVNKNAVGLGELNIGISNSIVKYDETNRTMVITMAITGGTRSYVVSDASLCYKKSSVEYLFSRFSFDPITIGAGDKDTITYTIRF